MLGDDGRLYVDPEIPNAIRQILIPIADVVLPNVSELGWLTDRIVDGQDAMISAARSLLEQGPSAVIVTGVREEDRIATYGISETAVWRADARYRARRFTGTGDLFSALFAGMFLRHRSISVPLAGAVASLDLVTGTTERRRSHELALVPALRRVRALVPTRPATLQVRREG